MADPVLHLLVGPNGAGKTTLFRRVIEPATGLAWVNADDIAAALGDAGPVYAYEASRRAAQRRQALIAGGRSFATETVFSHSSKSLRAFCHALYVDSISLARFTRSA